MSLTIIKGTDGYYVQGVSNSQPGTAYYLGQVKYQVPDPAGAGGRHIIGFDYRFREPVIMRAFFEPTSEQIGNWDPIGYVQYVRYSWARNGHPLRPREAFGPMASGWLPDTEQTGDKLFVDFMSPSAARKQLNLPEGIPYYAYNGKLMPGFTSVYADSSPAGSVFTQQSIEGVTQQAAYPSIVAGVASSLLTETIVKSFLANSNLLCTVDVPDGTPAYQAALAALTTTGAEPPLAGLEDTDVDAISVGAYVLLTLGPTDGMPDTICVSPAQNGQSDVHLLTVYDMDEMQYGLGSDLLWDITKYMAISGKRDMSPKARRGLCSQGQSNPLAAEGETDGMLVTYLTAAVGSQSGRTTRQNQQPMLSAVEWSAQLLFDPSSGRLNFGTITKPILRSQMDVQGADVAFSTVFNSSGHTVASTAPDDSRFRSVSIPRQLFGSGPGELAVEGGSSSVPS